MNRCRLYLRDLQYRYLKALGEPTGALPREHPPALALRWAVEYLTSKFVTWATTPRMHSTPTMGGAPAPMNLDPQSPGASTAATGEGQDSRDLLDMSPPKRGRTEAASGVTLDASGTSSGRNSPWPWDK